MTSLEDKCTWRDKGHCTGNHSIRVSRYTSVMLHVTQCWGSSQTTPSTYNSTSMEPIWVSSLVRATVWIGNIERECTVTNPTIWKSHWMTCQHRGSPPLNVTHPKLRNHPVWIITIKSPTMTCQHQGRAPKCHKPNKRSHHPVCEVSTSSKSIKISHYCFVHMYTRGYSDDIPSRLNCSR